MHVSRTCFGGVRRAWRFSAPITGPIFAFLTRWVILPCYKLIVFTKLRLGAVMNSTRGFFFLLFTHTYVLHAVVLLIAVSTVALQLQVPDATAADSGQRSILYALAAHDQEVLVEEAVEPSAQTTPVSYLDHGTIQAVPDIDFGYDEDVLADLTVPGSIAEQPNVPLPEPEPEDSVIIARTKTELYTVVEGDLVGTIARKFGVDVVTIISANGLSKQARIKPGDVLKIPPVSGVLHVVKRGDTVAKLAHLYKAEADKITSVNQLEERALVVGEELVIPGGTPPAPLSRPPVAVRPNVPTTRIPLKSYDKYQEIIDTRIDVRTRPANLDVSAVPQAKMIWPTSQKVITQYWSPFRHTGIDIDGEYSDVNVSVLDGVVESAGWNSSGYGLQVLIDHKDGRKTRYAHNSKLFVKAGDMVKKGQAIGMVGTTGRSTGTHLHFEVYVNGKRVNPLGYIK